jgi:hypothetical protein
MKWLETKSSLVKSVENTNRSHELCDERELYPKSKCYFLTFLLVLVVI